MPFDPELIETIAEDLAAEACYADMLAHPESVVDAFDLFDAPLSERDAEIVAELNIARQMILDGNSETAILDRIDRAIELAKRRE